MSPQTTLRKDAWDIKEIFREETAHTHENAPPCPIMSTIARVKEEVARCDCPHLRAIALFLLPKEQHCAGGRPCPVRAHLLHH